MARGRDYQNLNVIERWGACKSSLQPTFARESRQVGVIRIAQSLLRVRCAQSSTGPALIPRPESYPGSGRQGKEQGHKCEKR